MNFFLIILKFLGLPKFLIDPLLIRTSKKTDPEIFINLFNTFFKCNSLFIKRYELKPKLLLNNLKSI